MKKEMKPWEFYLLTTIALINLLIGFISKNFVMILVAFIISMYLRPHTKSIPIPKAYLKVIKSDGINTVEDLADLKKKNSVK